MKEIIFNDKKDIEKRKISRKNSTNTEKIIWNILRNRKLSGYKFKRQYSIDRFVVDFYCPELKLAIEIDGEIHDSKESFEYDRVREKFIQELRIKIIRFRNDEVYDNLESVVTEIKNNLIQSTDLTP